MMVICLLKNEQKYFNKVVILTMTTLSIYQIIPKEIWVNYVLPNLYIGHVEKIGMLNKWFQGIVKNYKKSIFNVMPGSQRQVEFLEKQMQILSPINKLAELYYQVFTEADKYNHAKKILDVTIAKNIYSLSKTVSELNLTTDDDKKIDKIYSYNQNGYIPFAAVNNIQENEVPFYAMVTNDEPFLIPKSLSSLKQNKIIEWITELGWVRAKLTRRQLRIYSSAWFNNDNLVAFDGCNKCNTKDFIADHEWGNCPKTKCSYCNTWGHHESICDDNPSRDNRCHKCKQHGHSSLICTRLNDIVCYNCGQKGHTTSKCKIKRNRNFKVTKKIYVMREFKPLL